MKIRWEGFYTPTRDARNLKLSGYKTPPTHTASGSVISKMSRRLFVLALLACAAVSRAHDPGLSSLHLAARPDSVDVLLQFAPADAALLVPLDTDGDGRVSRPEFEAARPLLDALPARWLALRRGDEPIALRAMSVHFEEKQNNIVLRMIIPAAPAGDWTLLFPKLIALPPGHRQLVVAVGPDGRIAAQKPVEASQPWLALTWPAATPPAPGPGNRKI
jgi:hypothetical protein